MSDKIVGITILVVAIVALLIMIIKGYGRTKNDKK
jgi:uncharacterized membrane protein